MLPPYDISGFVDANGSLQQHRYVLMSAIHQVPTDTNISNTGQDTGTDTHMWDVPVPVLVLD